MRHKAAVFSTIVATTAALAAVSGPAAAAVPGFDVKITQLPGSFAAGADPGTVTVVASTDVGKACQKVRWSMVLEVDGVDLDQVRVDRVEDTGSFPLQVQTDGDTARLTDARLDPGELCPGRTVTARYRVSFADGADDGKVTFQPEAYDVNNRLLQRTTATSQVVNGDQDGKSDDDAPATPAPTRPTASASAPATGDDGVGTVEPPADNQAGATTRPPGAIAAVPAAAAGDHSLLGVGLIVGALFIFLGVGLLLRLRMRARRSDPVGSPTGFYPAG